MNQLGESSLHEHFNDLPDPRINRHKRHELADLLIIAICAMICGADGWVQIQQFGQSKLNWFKTFLTLPNGIPSHDTFGRVFAALDPVAFEKCFANWVNSLRADNANDLIAIDGTPGNASPVV